MYPTNCPELNIRKFCLKCFKNDEESTQITSFNNNNNLSKNYKEKSVGGGIFDKLPECFETNCPCFFRKRRQIGVINNEQQENNQTPVIPITIAPEPNKKQQSATLAHLQTTKSPNSVNSAESVKSNPLEELTASDDNKSIKSKASSATVKIDELGKGASRPQSLTPNFDGLEIEESRPKSKASRPQSLTPTADGKELEESRPKSWIVASEASRPQSELEESRPKSWIVEPEVSKPQSLTPNVDGIDKSRPKSKASPPQSLTPNVDGKELQESRPMSDIVEPEVVQMTEKEIIDKEIEGIVEMILLEEPELTKIATELTPKHEIEIIRPKSCFVEQETTQPESIESFVEKISESPQPDDVKSTSISPDSIKSLEISDQKDESEQKPPETTPIEIVDETDGCETQNELEEDIKGTEQIEDYDTGEDTETNEEIREIEETFESIQPKRIIEPPIQESKKKAFLIRKSAPKYKALIAKTNSTDVMEGSNEKIKSPKEALSRCISQLESKNWEVTVTGLKLFVNLIQQHPQIIDTQIHLMSVLLAKHIKNLRSQVSRAACNASELFFQTHSRTIEPEADDLSIPLFYKTADTNKFLRADANSSLDSMGKHLTPAKVVQIICTKGAKHQNAIVRTTSARLILNLTKNLGCDNIFNLSKDCRDKLILTGAGLLSEGSLETRNYTREFFKQLHTHPNYNKTLVEVIPPRTFRNIEKTLKSIK